MTIGDIPEEIAHTIYNQAYRDGFMYGSQAKCIPDSTLRRKRLADYRAWLIKQSIKQQQQPKSASLARDPVTGLPVVPLFPLFPQR